MRRPREFPIPVDLICFYTKKGAETKSPYEAEIWKSHSTPVYIRFKRLDGIVLEALVREIRLKYKCKAVVVAKCERNNKKFELTNTVCDTLVICYNELAFFRDNPSKRLKMDEAWEECFTSPDDEDCGEQIAKERENGKTISMVYYTEHHYSPKMQAMLPDVVEYDANTHIVTTKCYKYYLIQAK